MEVNDRFSISSYLGEKKVEKPTGVNSYNFGQLVSKSQASIQERLNDPDLQEIFKNKSVSMMFLDKITKLLGKHHPDSLEARKFMFGPCCIPSMELIRHLSAIKSKVSPDAALHLEEWIESEQDCLPIALIFDAWLLSNEDLTRLGAMKGAVINKDAGLTITPPPREVEAFVNALASEMKRMQPGDSFKMPTGSSRHVTRLQFIKNADGTFDVFHFDTASKTSTAVKFASVPSKILEGPDFWKKLVEAKMQPEMEVLENLLLDSCGNASNPVDDRLKKPLQENSSCSFHAAEAEFKHFFISSFPTIDEGWQAYKQCTSLMASNAVKQETSLEPAIERMLQAKENVRKRYLDWMTIVDNPEKFNAAKNAYMEAIASIGKHSKEENEKLIANQPPLMALKLLDKRLNQGLEVVSYEQLIHIRDTYGAAVTFEGFNHMGYKQLKWIESTREVLQDVADLAGWKGDLLLNIRSISSFLLPGTWNSELQTKINYAVLDKDSLKRLLTEYLLREDPEKANQLFETLIKEKAVDENFTYEIDHIFNYVMECPHPDLEIIRKEVADLQRSKPYLLSYFCRLLIFRYNIEKALIAMDIAIHMLDQGSSELEAICSIIAEHGTADEITRAIDYLRTESTHSHIEQEHLDKALIHLSAALAKTGRIEEALNNIRTLKKTSDTFLVIDETLGSIALGMAQRGNTIEAIALGKTLNKHTFRSTLEDILKILVEKGDLEEATQSIHTLQKEFANDATILLVCDTELQEICLAYAKLGKQDEGKDLAETISDTKLKEQTLLTISKNLKT